MCARKNKDVLDNLQISAWTGDVQGCRHSNNPEKYGRGSGNKRGVIGCIAL
jgi:hypothetical protein